MSDYIFDMPHGGELKPDPPSHAFGQEHYSAFLFAWLRAPPPSVDVFPSGFD
jgi:hypothetical protein